MEIVCKTGSQKKLAWDLRCDVKEMSRRKESRNGLNVKKKFDSQLKVQENKMRK